MRLKHAKKGCRGWLAENDETIVSSKPDSASHPDCVTSSHRQLTCIALVVARLVIRVSLNGRHLSTCSSSSPTRELRRASPARVAKLHHQRHTGDHPEKQGRRGVVKHQNMVSSRETVAEVGGDGAKSHLHEYEVILSRPYSEPNKFFIIQS